MELTYEEHLAAHAQKFDKAQLMEAFTTEQNARKLLNDELNQERKVSAMHRYDAMAWQDAWLESVIRYDVEIAGDTEEAIEEYFAHPNRHVIMTENKGFYAFTDEGDHLFIWFAWTNPRAWSRERKDMVKLIRELCSYGIPVRYTGVNNIMKRHSVEIAPNLYELKLNRV